MPARPPSGARPPPEASAGPPAAGPASIGPTAAGATSGARAAGGGSGGAGRAGRLARDWPAPADAAAAARLLERFAALGAAEARFAAGPGRGLLACLGGNSAFLAGLALREPGCLRRLARDAPERVAAAALDALRGVAPQAPRAEVAAALRRARREVALLTAVADIAGMWGLEQVTGSLSDLAEAALGLAVSHLLHAAVRAGELRLSAGALAPGGASGFVVLGMGKLGARELNYSSDVDLVLLFDPEAHPYHENGLGAAFSRIARDLVTLMERRDADGFVFRCDLRLRPDPAATPPAVALPGALAYYESLGQNWERAAMIKARPVAGDLALGRRFLDAIRPFVWRRHLDFAAIADIAGMKRRIDDHKGTSLASAGTPARRLLGHDVKLGQGGIREVEFLAQCLQLVWGGRDPRLREPRTLPALAGLAAAGHLPAATVARLDAAYRVLRAVEHRLQMVDDRQTHALPATPEGLAAFATFMGDLSGGDPSGGDAARDDAARNGAAKGDADGFAGALLGELEAVHAAFAGLLAPLPSFPEELDMRGAGEPPPATLAALRGMGFARPDAVVAAVRGWQAGRPRALRSERARTLLRVVLPALLAALARSRAPDEAFGRLDALLTRLPAGVQLFSMLARNPALLERLAGVLGAAPMLADHLAAVPAALEGLFGREGADPDPAGSLALQLADARGEGEGLEDVLALAQRFVRGEEFRLACAQMEGRLDADAAGLARAALAEAVIGLVLPRVMAGHVRRYGRVRGGGLAVVALGKAGGREMMAGSDLDLLLVYDHPEGVGESTGARPVPVSQYYIRAAHAVVAALTAQGREGPLYAVDMRLRPSGNKGPVAVSLAGFRRYHAQEAWTWERMALTRARVVAGPARLRGRVAAALRAALAHGGRAGHAGGGAGAGEAGGVAGATGAIGATGASGATGSAGASGSGVRADAAAMRRRLARDLPADGPWDVKHRAGGLMEVEFVAQVLQLEHAAAHPRACSPVTVEALRRLCAGGLLAPADAGLLIRADRAWRTVQGLLRITVGPRPGAVLPAPALAALLRDLPAALERDPAGDPPGALVERQPLEDSAGLQAVLDGLAADVRAVFERVVGPMEGQA